MANEIHKRPSFFKRQFVVMPQVQYIFIYYSLFVGAIFFATGSAATAIVLKFASSDTSEVSLFGRNENILAVLLVVLLISSMIFGLYLSNRIAGPIFRIMREMIKVENIGDMKEISLRKDDFFQEVANAYNKLLRKLREQELGKKGHN